jgi:hypothetical protein
VPQHTADYATRPVANIFNGETLTREEFGEYLIAREQDRLQNFINMRIIEHACREKGIEVTAAEVDTALQEDLGKLNVTPADFVGKILKRYHKTLYEWKQDVILPRLLMTRLIRNDIQVDAEDLRKAFESYHGEKVDCKIIMWDKTEKQRVERDLYTKIRDTDEEFNRAAKYQASPTLASREGHLDKPISRWSTGNEELEKVVFALQPGEVSRIIDTPDGIVVVKCIKHIPPDTSVSLESEREQLTREIVEKKIQLRIPEAFKQLRENAHVQTFIESPSAREEQMMQLTKEAIKDIPTGILQSHQ